MDLCNPYHPSKDEYSGKIYPVIYIQLIIACRGKRKKQKSIHIECDAFLTWLSQTIADTFYSI